MTQPSFIDTHCHLEMDQFAEDLPAVIQRAFDAGVESMITIASDPDSNAKAIEIAEQYPSVYASVGIHPHEARLLKDEFYEQMSIHSKHAKVVAIGETGLDYHYDHSPRDVQQKVFLRHLLTANETGLPAIIHSREAKDDTLRIMEDSKISKGVLHCFSGDLDMAERAMNMGLFISIAGPVTFKKAEELRDIVRKIPDDFLLIETDAPYLAPVPYRGKRNEPAYVVNTARMIAEVRGVTLEDIARITTLNARRLFSIGEVSTEGQIVYKIRNSLYLNITNRCTNRCGFCVRGKKDFVKGHNLRLDREPTDQELIDAIGDPTRYTEIVFCGYGEPTLRLDVIKSVASWVKDRGGQVRINTNGHGNLIHKRNILPELKGFVDSLSISLDAQDEETYNIICLPVYKEAFKAVIDFAREAKNYIPRVMFTIVEMDKVDTEASRRIAKDIGVEFRVRKMNVVG